MRAWLHRNRLVLIPFGVVVLLALALLLATQGMSALLGEYALF